MTRVIIELEFEGSDLPSDALKEAVYAYLQELMDDDSLYFEVVEKK